MPIDRIMIKSRFKYGHKYVKKIDEILEKSATEFQEDLDLQLKGERIFEILTQIILDICTHKVANSELDIPKSYADCLRSLSKLDILSKEEANRFSSLLKMRNIIVHQYISIDYETVFEGLEKLKTDYKFYQQKVLEWLHQKKTN